jgi:pyruvate kinase
MDEGAATVRRTKIIATIGPATWDPAVLEELIRAGADVLRLNFSHAGAERHRETIGDIRDAAQRAGREVAILGDLPGPKLRIGSIKGDVVELRDGDEVALTEREVEGDESTIPVHWQGMAERLKPGEPVFLADGAIRLRVREVRDSEVLCEVEVGGSVSSHKGMNLPGSDTGLPAVDEDDLEWVDFSARNGVDLLAVSFVRRAADLTPVQERLDGLGSDIPLIAKIEKPEAAENAEEIIGATTSGIMVARGDLGIELPLARVPIIQKELIRLAGRLSRPSITATQMLASMVSSSRPTRAEVADVANAIWDGTDAVMLSEETAVGRYPVEAVQVMDRIARETELALPYGEWLFRRTNQEVQDVADSVAQSAVTSAYRLGLKAMIVPTVSGRTARLVSAHRPRVPVLAISPRIQTVRRMNLLFGTRAILDDQTTEIRDLLHDCANLAGLHGVAASGDLVAIVAGLPDQELGTNLFEVHRVP